MLPTPAVVLVALVSVLAGCANVPLYSEARDKQGQAAKKAWSEVGVKDKIAVARENLQTLLDREIATGDRLTLERRDQLIRSMATGGTVKQRLVDPVDAALKRLAGSRDLAAQWKAARTKQELVTRSLQRATQEMADVGVEMPSCSDITGNKQDALAPLQEHIANGGPKGSAVGDALNAARSACGNPNLTATASVPVGRAITATVAQLDAAALSLESARASTRNERNAYTAALDAHEKAVAQLKTDANALAKVQAAAAKLKSAVEKLEKAPDVFSDRFLSEQRLDSLNRFLSAVADTKAGEPPPEGASRAAVALILFSRLADDTKKALADAKTPTLVPLVLQLNHQKIKLDAATRDIAAREAVLALYQQKLALQSKQADQYLNAANGFDANTSFHPLTLDAALAGTGSDLRGARNTLLEATALYLDTEGRLQSEVVKTNYRINAAAHESALAYAESNVAQWDGLITSGVDQLSDYGASGIKPEMIAAFLNSLTLLWIGIGVN